MYMQTDRCETEENLLIGANKQAKNNSRQPTQQKNHHQLPLIEEEIKQQDLSRHVQENRILAPDRNIELVKPDLGQPPLQQQPGSQEQGADPMMQRSDQNGPVDMSQPKRQQQKQQTDSEQQEAQIQEEVQEEQPSQTDPSSLPHVKFLHNNHRTPRSQMNGKRIVRSPTGFVGSPQEEDDTQQEQRHRVPYNVAGSGETAQLAEMQLENNNDLLDDDEILHRSNPPQQQKNVINANADEEQKLAFQNKRNRYSKMVSETNSKVTTPTPPNNLEHPHPQKKALYHAETMPEQATKPMKSSLEFSLTILPRVDTRNHDVDDER